LVLLCYHPSRLGIAIRDSEASVSKSPQTGFDRPLSDPPFPMGGSVLTPPPQPLPVGREYSSLPPPSPLFPKPWLAAERGAPLSISELTKFGKKRCFSACHPSEVSITVSYLHGFGWHLPFFFPRPWGPPRQFVVTFFLPSDLLVASRRPGRLQPEVRPSESGRYRDPEMAFSVDMATCELSPLLLYAADRCQSAFFSFLNGCGGARVFFFPRRALPFLPFTSPLKFSPLPRLRLYDTNTAME